MESTHEGSERGGERGELPPKNTKCSKLTVACIVSDIARSDSCIGDSFQLPQISRSSAKQSLA